MSGCALICFKCCMILRSLLRTTEKMRFFIFVLQIVCDLSCVSDSRRKNRLEMEDLNIDARILCNGFQYGCVDFCLRQMF